MSVGPVPSPPGHKMADMEQEYQPLYAERRCLVCGQWRGQHLGESTDDGEMHCPVDASLASWYQTVPTFVPNLNSSVGFRPSVEPK